MKNFRRFRLDSPELAYADTAVAMLFSGKTSAVLSGLAWIGGACNTLGYDVNVVTPFGQPAIMAARMLGHSLGAPHDNNTVCHDQPDHIMSRYVTDNTNASFLSCSVESIQQSMQGDYCHTAAIDLEMVLEKTDPNGMTLSVHNKDTERTAPRAYILITGSDAQIVAPDSNCTIVAEHSLRCTVGSLLPMQSMDYYFDFNESASVYANIEFNSDFEIPSAITTDSGGESINSELAIDHGGVAGVVCRPAGGSVW